MTRRGKWRKQVRQAQSPLGLGMLHLEREAPAPGAAAAGAGGGGDGRFDSRAYDFRELDRAAAYRDSARVCFYMARRGIGGRYCGFLTQQAEHAAACARIILQNLKEYRKLYKTAGLP